MRGMNDAALVRMAGTVLEIEAAAIRALLPRLDAGFVAACKLLLACRGRAVVTGIGKSGHIAHKVAATFASTGTPAFYLHPAEALHGDLGMITAGDVVVAFSNSGESAELVSLLPDIRRRGSKLLALTGNRNSTLAQEADVHLDTSVEREACPLGLAPTASTTAALAMGDALAIALLESRGFTSEDFARAHPGGRLGKRLWLRVSEVMHSGSDLPCVGLDAGLGEAIVEMTAKRLGMCAIVDEQRRLCGVITDGDLRRALDHGGHLRQTTLAAVMNRDPKTIAPQALAAEAAALMQEYHIQGLLVTEPDGRLIGAFNFQDLLQSGVV